MASASISSFPKRKLLPRDAAPEFDKHGFLSAFQDAEGFEAFLDRQLVLVIAPPWMGKSFVSKQLKQHFDRSTAVPGQSPFGRFVHRTDFERDSSDEIVPSWWDEWRQSPERACWIIDAVDEDGRSGSKGSHRLMNVVSALTPGKRSTLCVLMFARENEMPKKVEERLREIYGEPDIAEGVKYCVLRLAPMDAECARGFLGDEAFKRACKLITLNHLQSVAGYPSVLQRLSHYAPDQNLDDVNVWKHVLLDLMKDKNADPVALPRKSPLDLQFKAAARIAVILTFSDCDAVRESDGYFDGPSIDALIPPDHRASEALNRAGQDVLRSGIFRRSTGGLQFAQHHVQQWLAAFGAAELSLSQLRPLLTDRAGNALPIHRGLMGLLMRTTRHHPVKDWIIEQHGGIAPRSDAAPWDLAQSRTALDRLQAIVKTTAWGLSFWNDRGLSFLAAPGLGIELVKRLSDKSISPLELRLIMEVAIATHSSETVPTAMAIALDKSAPSDLRDYATTVVVVLGDKSNWLTLAANLSEPDVGDSSRDAMRGIVVMQLYKKGIWDFATTVREAPPPDSRSGALYYRLEKDMTIDNARTLLASVDVEKLAEELDARHRERKRYRWAELVAQAIKLIVDQPNPLPSDYKLLLPIALAQYRPDWRSHDQMRLGGFIAQNREARRDLIRAIINGSPEGADDVTWQIRSILVPEDLEWLASLAVDEGGRHPWLWPQILQAASWKTTPVDIRERVRAQGREKVPQVLRAVDEEQTRAEEREKEYQRQEQEYEKEKKIETFDIRALVDDTLGNREIPLCEQMHRLSWFCFCDDSFRPTNVVGKWEDLGAARQQRVLAVCEKALRNCNPTPIPVANSYPMPIVYEAYCFVQLSQLHQNPNQFDATLVEKWLQSALAVSTTHHDLLVSRCYATTPAATEEVLRKELVRRLSFEPQSVFWLDSLPPVVWSRGLCNAFAAVGDDDHYALPGRASLLRKLFIQNKSCALPILARWIKEADHNKRIAAVDLLVATDPDLVWEEFKKQVQADGKAAFLRIGGLAGEHRGLHAGLSSWRAVQIEELHTWLIKAFPPDTDPVREEGVACNYSPEDAYRDVRKQLAPLLFSRGTAEDLAALDRMADRFEPTREWYTHAKAQTAAGAVLGEVLPEKPLTKQPTAPFAKVARLLDVAVYRLVRTAADLQAVLVEEIVAIASDAKEHLSCLYYPRKSRKTARGGGQKSLQEDALQAYFYCRLSDRLKGRVLEQDTKVILNREPLTTKDQRLDIKVEAPTLEGNCATVVIELKWSDHKHVSTCLYTQLGQEYLVNSQFTHGIYLVGWNKAGRWRDRTAVAPADLESPDAWRDALVAQATAFSQVHATVSVVPLVIDLAWPSSQSGIPKKIRKRISKPKARRRNPPRVSSKPAKRKSRPRLRRTIS